MSNNINWGKLWNCFKHKCIQFLGGLVMEKNDEGRYVASMGRISWWIAFIPAVYIWVSSRGMLSGAGDPLKDISPNHLNILIMLAGYNFGKKAIDVVNNLFGKKNKLIAPPDQDGPG